MTLKPPFSKPRVIYRGEVEDCMNLMGEAYNLLFQVRQFCEASGVPVFAMSRKVEGGVVHAAVIGGQDVVSVTPAARVEDVSKRQKKIAMYLPAFWGIPLSETHLAGFTPVADPALPGPSARWGGYLVRNPPPQLDSYRLARQQTGEVTWDNPAIRYQNYPIVLSWRGPLHRYGKFAFPSVLGTPAEGSVTTIYGPGLFFSTTRTAPTTPLDFISNYNLHAGVRQPSVWLNGYSVTLTGASFGFVYSAALQVRDNKVYLRAYNGLKIYEAVLFGEGGFAGMDGLIATTTRTLVMTVIAEIPAGTVLVQTPYFNRSATRLVTIRVADATSVFPASNSHNGNEVIVEFDISSASFLTPVMEGASETASTQSASYADSGVYEYDPGGLSSVHRISGSITGFGSSSSSSSSAIPVAADYDGNDVVYCHIERNSSSASSEQYSYSSGANEWTGSRTGSASGLQSIELHHSRMGLLLSGTKVEESSFVETQSSTEKVMNTLMESSTSGLPPESGAWIWGDLRKRSFIVASPDLGGSSVSQTALATTDVVSPGVSFTLFVNGERKPRIDVGPGQVTTVQGYEPSVDFPDDKTPRIDEDSWPDTSGMVAGDTFGVSGSGGGTETATTTSKVQHGAWSSGLSSVPLEAGAFAGDSIILRSPLWCSVAASPLREVTYIGLHYRGSYSGSTYEGSIEKMYRGTTEIPLPTYAAGTHPTIFSPVFLGVVPGDPVNINEAQQ